MSCGILDFWILSYGSSCRSGRHFVQRDFDNVDFVSMDFVWILFVLDGFCPPLIYFHVSDFWRDVVRMDFVRVDFSRKGFCPGDVVRMDFVRVDYGLLPLLVHA